MKMKFTIAYTLLFVYIIAAIVFWGYSLDKQARTLHELEIQNLNARQSKLTAVQYQDEINKLEDKRVRRRKQYLGEGGTFLLITIFASALIYIAYYRQRKLSQIQKNFMLSVTHELKTPVAGIKLNMQTMQRHKLDEENQNKLIHSTISESNRLHDLCNNILVATQLESRRGALYPENIDLIALLQTEVNEYKSRYPSLNIEFQTNLPQFNLKGETTLWKLVISNLIENARKYTVKDPSIKLVLQNNESHVVLQVQDQGVGISEDEKEYIFNKFYRVGNENVRTSKGTGLGLYLVKKIVTLYKYDISVKNNTPQGSIFEVKF